MLYVYFFGWLILLWGVCSGKYLGYKLGIKCLYLATNDTSNDVPGCLDLRNRCRGSLACRTALKSLSECGNSLIGCIQNNSDICLASLANIRHIFNLTTCSCNVQKSKFDECIKFRTKIWNNPCETSFVEEFQQVESGSIDKRDVRRFTRRNSEQIQRWKKEFRQGLLTE